MFYVSKRDGSNYGVIDTEDGVEELFTKEQLFNIVRKKNIEIDGVDLADSYICVVKPTNETVRLFKQGKIHLAISTMTINGDWFGLRFKSKPTGGEMNFVSNEVINISRTGVNRFAFDKGYSKSYRSGLTFNDIMTVLEGFSSYKLVDCKLGRF